MKAHKLVLALFILLISCAFLGCEAPNVEPPEEVVVKEVEYDSIEELHADYVTNCLAEEGSSRTCFPRDLVTYFFEGDKCFIVCTYSKSNSDPALQKGKLLIYTARVSGGKYVLSYHPSIEISKFKISQKVPKKNELGETQINGEMIDVSFVCKKVTSKYNYYFDGNRMKEVEFTNPFSKEKMILCYGVSNSNVFWDSKHVWYSLPISDTNSVEYVVNVKEDKILAVIAVSTLPMDTSSLIDFVKDLADEIEANEEAQKILNGGKIDRRQLYAELKFHLVCWQNDIIESRTSVADIEIYEGGAVIDSRPWLNPLVLEMYGDEYIE